MARQSNCLKSRQLSQKLTIIFAVKINFSSLHRQSLLTHGSEMTSKSSVCLRKQTQIWLIGPQISELIGAKFPSLRQVISLLKYHLKSQDESESANLVAQELLDKYWSAEGIKPTQKPNIVSKIKHFYSIYKKLRKSANRPSNNARDTFISELDNVFDISHQDAASHIKNDNDMEFYLHMKKTKKSGVLGPVDIKAERKKRLQTRDESLLQRRKRRQVEPSTPRHRPSILSDDENEQENELENTSQLDESDKNYEPSSQSKKRKRDKSSTKCEKKKVVLTPEVCLNLDRTQTSDSKAVRLVTSIIHATGQNPNDFKYSKEYSRTSRLKARKLFDVTNKETVNDIDYCTIHYDGKNVRKNRWKCKEDQLPVIANSGNIEKLLGIYSMSSGTAANVSDTVFNAVTEWKMHEKVIGQGFDTTSVNTGSKGGAVILLEKKFGRDLLALPCRHHVFELIIGAVYDELFGESSGPSIGLFQYFVNVFKELEISNLNYGLPNDKISDEEKTELLDFINDQFSSFQPRDDYREFLELAYIILDGNKVKKFTIKSPGAVSHARWMCKIIYIFKLYLYRDQLILLESERESLLRFIVFILKVYLRMWYVAPVAASAPSNDLNFLKQLYDFKSTDNNVATVALKKFSNHLWYLNDVNVCFSLFDGNLSNDIRENLAKLISQTQNVSAFNKKATIDIDKVNELMLENFVSVRSRDFFKILNTSADFLDLKCNDWPTNSNYVKLFSIVKHIKVVNDSAERGVKLMTEYLNKFTKNEEDKQFLYRSVHEHRKFYPSHNRKDLINYCCNKSMFG